MSDIVTRLWGNTANYPGFENIKTEAAREIDRLRARLAAWKAEAEAWRQADDCDPMVRGECIREARERRAATNAIEKNAN